MQNVDPLVAAATPELPRTFLHRTRLLDRLDRSAAEGKRLVVVRAPGGSGKTLLLADWIRGRASAERTVWIALDRRAETRRGFWFRVATEIAREHPSREGFPELDDLLLGIGAVAHAPAVLLDVLNAPAAPDRVIIDDFHLVDDETADDVAWLLTRLQRTQLVVATRRRTALDAPELAVRIEVESVRPAELAFTDDDAEAFIGLASALDGRTGDEEEQRRQAERLVEATRGHALSFRVALASADAATDAEEPAEHADPRPGLLRASRSVLPDLPEPDRAIALRVALVPAVDGPLGAALTSRPAEEVVTTLRRFEHDGLGELGDSGLFRFHDLVRDGFAALAAEELGGDERRRILRTGWQAFATRPGWALTALELAALAADGDAVWALFVRNFSDLINHLQEQTERAIRLLPPETIAEAGTPGIALAVIRSEREPRPSLETMRLVDQGLDALRRRQPATDEEDAYLRALGELAALRAARRYAEAAPAADRLVAVVERMSAAQLAGNGPSVGVGILQAVITQVLTARVERALEVSDLLGRDRHPVRSLHRDALVAFLHAVRGDVRAARRTLTDIPESRLARWRNAIPAVGWYTATAISHLEAGDTAAARSAIGALDDRLHLIEHWPYVLWVHGRVALVSDDLPAASERFRALVAEHRGRLAAPDALDLVRGVLACVELAAGNAGAAREAVADDGRPVTAPVALARARIALVTGDPEEAGRLAALVLAESDLWPRQRAEALVVAAAAQSRSGSAEAVETMRRAVAYTEPLGLDSPRSLVPRDDLDAIVARSGGRLAPLPELPDPFGGLDAAALTTRERRVLSGLATGATLQALADADYVTVNTVKSQVRSLYRKLGARSRDEALTIARRRGM